MTTAAATMATTPCVTTVISDVITGTPVTRCLDETITPSTDSAALINTIVTTVIAAFGMIGIGCSVNYKVLWSYFKQPKAFLTGVILQLFLVPLIAWALVKAFQMPQIQALSVMIQGGCPGGSVSNIVVYWLGGVVDLSVAMTATSTLLALGTMPLWLLIFQSAENAPSALRIPFEQLGIALAAFIIPLALGIAINAKFKEEIAKKVSRVLVVLSSIGITGWLIYTIILRASIWRVTWEQVVIAVIMPVIIFIIGYVATMLPGIRLDKKCRKTVAIEMALQNVQVAVAIIALSFGDQPRIQFQMVAFPLMYYALQVGFSILLCVGYQLAKKWGLIKVAPDVGGAQNDEKKNGSENFTYEKDDDEKSQTNAL